MKIFITGATGRLGKHVLQKLDNAIPLVRKPAKLENEVVTDFSVGQLKTIFEDADVIVHLAGSVDFDNPKRLGEGNVGLTWRIAYSAPAKARIVFASSVTVYGKKLKKIPANEETPLAPDSEYSKTKKEAEDIIKKAKNHVILRIGNIYGPEFRDYIRVLNLIKNKKMFILGKGENHLPFIHVEDVADAIAAATKKGDGVYVLSGECKTQKEVFETAAKLMDIEPPKTQIPITIAKILLKVIGGRTFKEEHVNILTADRIFDCSKAEKELGFKPRPLKDGIAEVIESMNKLQNQNP